MIRSSLGGRKCLGDGELLVDFCLGEAQIHDIEEACYGQDFASCFHKLYQMIKYQLGVPLPSAVMPVFPFLPGDQTRTDQA